MIVIPKFTHVTPQSHCYNNDRKNPTRLMQGTMITEKEYNINIPIGTILNVHGYNVIFLGFDLPTDINYVNHSNSVGIWNFDMIVGDTYTEPNDILMVHTINETTCVEITKNSNILIYTNAFLYIQNIGLVMTDNIITASTDVPQFDFTNINRTIDSIDIFPNVYIPKFTKISLCGPSNNIRPNNGSIMILDDININFNNNIICKIAQTNENITFVNSIINNNDNEQSNNNYIFILPANTKISTNTQTIKIKNDLNIILPNNTTIILSPENYIRLNNMGVVKLIQNLEVIL